MSKDKPGQKQPDSPTGCIPADSVVPADKTPKCSNTDIPVSSSPCLLDAEEDFNPDYLPDYSKKTQ